MASEKRSQRRHWDPDSAETRKILDQFGRFVPAMGSSVFRATVGFLFLLAFLVSELGIENPWYTIGFGIFCAATWYVSTFLTQKYVHKYPYRYYSYLVASHFKAAMLVLIAIGLGSLLSSQLWEASVLLAKVFGAAALFDFILAFPRKKKALDKEFDASKLNSREMSAQAESVNESSTSDEKDQKGRGKTLYERVKGELDSSIAMFAESEIASLNADTVATLAKPGDGRKKSEAAHYVYDLMVWPGLLNDVRRINRFLIREGQKVEMGGHLVGRYQSLEFKRAQILNRAGKRLFWPVFVLNFAWYRAFPKVPVLNKLYFLLSRGKGRHVSKAEVWGRLSYCGFRVIKEREDDQSTMFIAVKVATPITNKRPSYYPVIALEKLGMDGRNVKIHKMRSMYPFSEFLQKQIFEEHGLATTGKFKNDFRLTEYGKYIRRYWLDEIPQFYDWLRGDIKIVGIRATSAHFLSLYPPSFMDFYIKVKPGLISPIFDENTQGLDKIVQVELDYLIRYMSAPLKTDLQTLLDTLKDILFRGVRSK